MSLINQVRKTISRYNLLDMNDRVVVGVSGGPDSVALILLLKSLKKEFNLSLSIAHLDHQLRKDSYRDREFVNRLAAELKLPFASAKVNLNKGRGSIEELARQARLRFLFSVAGKVRADKIALGHNLDDQAETVLMRTLRGTGLSGLCSILPRRTINNRIIIRPLIEARRADIESYLNRRRIKPCLDSSNKDIVYFRNRIRNCLIPELVKHYNPNTKQVLANLAQTAACDYDYLEGAAGKVFNRLRRPVWGKRRKYAPAMRFKIKELSKLHSAIQRLVLRFSIARVQGSSLGPGFKHIKEIEELISCRPTGSIVDLPGNVSVMKDKQYVCIYRRRTVKRKRSSVP